MSQKSYCDVYGRRHTVTSILSSGGQGVVYRTQEPNTLLKLEWDPSTGEIGKNVATNEKFREIGLLPIPGRLHVTLPQSVLRDAAGYTMRLLDEMVSFEDAFSGEGKEPVCNEWLEQFRESNPAITETFGLFIATGGKRKRLEAFLRSACILSELHANGLVYCDISDKNMFVSEAKGRADVWFIDVDNLDFIKNTGRKRGWRTPGFGAPEVIQGRGNTFYSDAFSFAVALFWTVAGTHPYVGPALEEVLEGEDILDMPEEDYACSGSVPWVAEQEDGQQGGIPYELIFSEEILEHFDRTFGEQGRNNRVMRTTMPEWAYVLAKERDRIIHCHKCDMEYDGEQNEICPWCDFDNSVLTIRTFELENGEKRNPIWNFIHERTEELLWIPVRILEGFRCGNPDRSAFSIQQSEEEMTIDHLQEEFEFKLSSDGSVFRDIYGKTKIRQRGGIKMIARKRHTEYEILIEIKE